MDIPDEKKLRLRAVKQLVNQSDIDQLYGNDQATLEMIQSKATTEQIPPEVDEAVTTFLSEFDIELGGSDVLIAPVLRVLFTVARVKELSLRRRILATKVEQWIIRAPVSTTTLETPDPDLYKSSCHECGEEFNERRHVCPSFNALIPRNR